LLAYISDDIKVCLAEPKQFDWLLNILKGTLGSEDEDQVTVRNLMADLIVLLLTGGLLYLDLLPH